MAGRISMCITVVVGSVTRVTVTRVFGRKIIEGPVGRSKAAAQ